MYISLPITYYLFPRNTTLALANMKKIAPVDMTILARTKTTTKNTPLK